MRIEITIELDNDAFQGASSGDFNTEEVKRILVEAAEEFDEANQYENLREGNAHPLHDINGNRVGYWAVHE